MKNTIKVNFEHNEFVDTHVCIKVCIRHEREWIYQLLEYRRQAKDKTEMNDGLKRAYTDLCNYRRLDHKLNVISAKRRKAGYIM